MRDLRNEFVKKVETEISSMLPKEYVDVVMAKIMDALGSYELSERTTAVVTVDDTNMQIVKTYMGSLMLDGKSKSTAYVYGRQLARFLEFTGNKLLLETTTFDIRSYLASERSRGVSDRSVENTRANLSAFFNWLTAEEYIQKNPCAAVRVIKCAKKKKHPFTNVEQDELRIACKDTKERAIIEFLFSSGVRVEELCNLRVEDIDFSSKAVNVIHGKGNKERITYLDDVAVSYLIKYLTENNIECGALFQNKSGDHYTTGGIRFILNSIASRTDVKDVHPHRFRHTFASTLAARGMSVQEIKVLMGHSDINTTMVYIDTNNAQASNSYRKCTA